MAQQNMDLTGLTVAILATDGVEQVELEKPRAALEEAGAKVILVSPKADAIQAMQHKDLGDKISVDLSLSEADADDFDALVLPGGVSNPDELRIDQDAMNFVRSFVTSDKPVAAICHGPWILIEADAVRGKNVTSWPSLKTDLRNAGAEWSDESVVVADKLVTSRKPDDIPDFNREVIKMFAEQLSWKSSESDALKTNVKSGAKKSVAPSAQI